MKTTKPITVPKPKVGLKLESPGGMRFEVLKVNSTNIEVSVDRRVPQKTGCAVLEQRTISIRISRWEPTVRPYL